MAHEEQLDGNSFLFLDVSNKSNESDPAHFYFLQHIISKKKLNSELLTRILDFLLRNFEEFCLPGEATNMYNDVLSMGGGVWKTLEALSANGEYRKSISQWSSFPQLLKSLDPHIVQSGIGLQRQKVVSVVLSNLCLVEDIANKVCENHPDWISRIFFNAMNSMGNKDFEKAKEEFYILQNITQTNNGRRLIFEVLETRDPVSPFSILYLDTTIPDNVRESVFGLTKNLAFDYGRQEEFFDKGIIGPLVLPLVGKDVFSEEENDKMHPDWQYMDKELDQSLAIKKLIMDTLLLLCNSRSVREKMRPINVYLILREYHLVEKNETLVDELENLINVLIRTEEEIGVEKLNLIYDTEPALSTTQ